MEVKLADDPLIHALTTITSWNVAEHEYLHIFCCHIFALYFSRILFV